MRKVRRNSNGVTFIRFLILPQIGAEMKHILLVGLLCPDVFCDSTARRRLQRQLRR